MAEFSDHLEQWRHNRSFLSVIPPQYPDWIVTVAFYTAVHAVDSLLARDRQTVTSHEARNDILIRTNRYQKIRTHCLQLYDLSRTVRYLAKPAKWVPTHLIMEKVIRELLYPIENSVQKLIEGELQLPPVSLQTS